jgi:hypothetical protein
VHKQEYTVQSNKLHLISSLCLTLCLPLSACLSLPVSLCLPLPAYRTRPAGELSPFLFFSFSNLSWTLRRSLELDFASLKLELDFASLKLELDFASLKLKLDFASLKLGIGLCVVPRDLTLCRPPLLGFGYAYSVWSSPSSHLDLAAIINDTIALRLDFFLTDLVSYFHCIHINVRSELCLPVYNTFLNRFNSSFMAPTDLLASKDPSSMFTSISPQTVVLI